MIRLKSFEIGTTIIVATEAMVKQYKLTNSSWWTDLVISINKWFREKWQAKTTLDELSLHTYHIREFQTHHLSTDWEVGGYNFT